MSVGFDTGDLAGQRTWWAGLIGHSSLLLNLGIAAMAAALVFGWTGIRDLLEQLGDRLAFARFGAAYLVAHLVLFAAFVVLTTRILGGGLVTWAWPTFWVGLWIASGTGMVGCLLAVAIPPALWWTILRRSRGLLLLGLTVGGLAIATSIQTRALWHPMGALTLSAVSMMLRGDRRAGVRSCGV